MDVCKIPRKVQSIKTAVLICEVWDHLFLVWDDCELHLPATVSKQLQVKKNDMKNWNLCFSSVLCRKRWIFVNRNLSY